MKQIYSNIKKGEVKVAVENLDDIWYLSHIIDKGDLVKGKTSRKVKVGKEETAEAVKKPVFIALIAENVEFSKTSNALRVSGKITEGPEDVAKGSYHTFTIEIGTIITIIKEKWYGYQLEKLKEACTSKIPKIIICVFDREEAFFAIMKRSGYDLVAHLKGEVEKKRVKTRPRTDFYRDVIAQLEDYDKRFEPEKIILASPAFWKEELMKSLANDALRKKIVQAACSSADETAIAEVLKRDETQNALRQDRITKEIRLVDEVLLEISRQGKVAYGFKEVKECAGMGAVDTLLVADSLIIKKRQDNSFEELDSLMKDVDRKKGRIYVISAEHEGGKKLEGLGGIASILRYRKC